MLLKNAMGVQQRRLRESTVKTRGFQPINCRVWQRGSRRERRILERDQMSPKACFYIE